MHLCELMLGSRRNDGVLDSSPVRGSDLIVLEKGIERPTIQNTRKQLISRPKDPLLDCLLPIVHGNQAHAR
jgi:hypothetical protein